MCECDRRQACVTNQSLNRFARHSYYHRGQVYFITQEFDKAIAEYRRSSEIDPSFIFSHIQLAVAQYKNKQTERAMHQFRRFIKEHPNSPEVFNYYGELLLDQGQYEEAVNNFERSIELDKNRCVDHTETCSVHVLTSLTVAAVNLAMPCPWLTRRYPFSNGSKTLLQRRSCVARPSILVGAECPSARTDGFC